MDRSKAGNERPRDRLRQSTASMADQQYRQNQSFNVDDSIADLNNTKMNECFIECLY